MSVNSTIIFAASMPRSGSTWLFNVARVLLKRQPNMDKNFSSGWIGDLPTIPVKPFMLIKVHDYDAALVKYVSFVFYSFRDLRDVLASRSRKFGIEPSMAEADKFIEHHALWMKRANFIMKYEDMAENKVSIVSGLATALNIKEFNAVEIIDELDQMKNTDNIKNSTFDPQSLYHQGHITDGRHGSWKNIVSAKLEKELLDKYGDWFRQYDYID